MMRASRAGFLGAVLVAAFTPAAGGPQSGASARMVVTVESHDSAGGRLTREDVLVYQGKERRQVTGWTPVRESGAQLWILIDEGADSTIGTQFSDLRKFIQALPANIEAGLGYMRNGGVTPAQSLTSDHSAVAKALRLPLGEPGISASPYLSVSELIRKWPATTKAREVLILSSGVDYVYGPGPQNPYLQSCIDETQRAGVVATSIYYGSSGHAGHSYWEIYWGQNNLSNLSEATGGEFYWQGMTNPVSIGPYLDEFTTHLSNQFVLSFVVAPAHKAQLEAVQVRTEIPHVSLVAQKRVLIPAAP